MERRRQRSFSFYGRRCGPAAAVVPTQHHFHPVAADGAVGLVPVVVIAEQRFCEVVLRRKDKAETERLCGAASAGTPSLTLHLKHKAPLMRGWRTSTASAPQHKQKPAETQSTQLKEGRGVKVQTPGPVPCPSPSMSSVRSLILQIVSSAENRHLVINGHIVLVSRSGLSSSPSALAPSTA